MPKGIKGFQKGHPAYNMPKGLCGFQKGNNWGAISPRVKYNKEFLKCPNCGEIKKRNEFFNTRLNRYKECENKFYRDKRAKERIKWEDGFCLVCKKPMKLYLPHQKYCSAECSYKDTYKDLDPIRKKAVTLSSCVPLGKGKIKFFNELVRNSIGKHCIYCGDMLILENLSLDHIQPFGSVKSRYDKLIKKQLDKPENLQIICKKCNQLKGTLSHDKFLKFLTFLNTDIEIKEYIINKMSRANLF